MSRPCELSAAMQPVEQARGLPNRHYISAETYAEERDSVLFANWAGIGFACDVSEPGHVKPVDFIGMPLLIVRDRDDTVRVFQNTCRHRGMILVEEAGPIRGVLRCPYHSWCYGLDGRLVTTPHVGGPGTNRHDAIVRDELGLVEVRSFVWRDVVFVNVSGTAPPFEEYARDLITRWAEFDQPIYPANGSNRFRFDVKTNWKLAVENYCESYHLPWIHPGLNSYSRLEDHYHIEEPGKFSGQGTLVYRQIEGENGLRFPDFENLSAQWDEGAEYVSFFPNVLFAVQRDHCYALLLDPKGPEETVEHVQIYYPFDPATRPDLGDLIERNGAQWSGVLEEDLFVVEGMQRGRHGVHFDGGRFSPAMDGPTHLFHAWVASQVVGEPSRDVGA